MKRLFLILLMMGLWTVPVTELAAQEGGHYDENVASRIPVDLISIRFGYDRRTKARTVKVRYKNRTNKTLKRFQVMIFQGTKGPRNWTKGMKWTKRTHTPQPKYVPAHTQRFDLKPNELRTDKYVFGRPALKNLKTIVVQFRWFERDITSWHAKTFPNDVTRQGLNRCLPSDKNSPDVDIVGVKFGKATASAYNQSAIIKLVNRNNKSSTPVVFRMHQRGINGGWLPVEGPANYFVNLKPGQMLNVTRQFSKRNFMAAFRVQAHKQNSRKMAEHITCFVSAI